MACLEASMAKVAAAAVPSSGTQQRFSLARFEGLKRWPVQRRRVVAFSDIPLVPSQRLQISCAKADSAIVEKVKDVICKQLAVDTKDVVPDSKIADLGADSLDTVEIMMALEEQFEITLNQEGNEKILTVQDAADLIHDVRLKEAKA